MAYSDYGGYGFLNGKRVADRSDCTIRPEGLCGTPGSYPAFAAIGQGATQEEALKIASYPHGHVVLGDGPIYLAMYKQSDVHPYRENKALKFIDFIKDLPKEAATEYDSGKYLENDYYINNGLPCLAEIEGNQIEIHWTHEDNYYQYVKMITPSGNIWTGFSGYGIGAGLEDAGYGYSTDDRMKKVIELFGCAT